jgi:hypothetical protein
MRYLKGGIEKLPLVGFRARSEIIMMTAQKQASPSYQGQYATGRSGGPK